MDKIKELNIEEVGRKIVAKHPYKIMMDDKQDGVPATEQSMFTDVLTFSVFQVGKSFQNIPYSLNNKPKFGGYERYSVELLDSNAEITEIIPPSRYNKFSDPDGFLREKEEFIFKTNWDKIIVAVILTRDQPDGKTNKYIMLLSKPMAVYKMQSMRDDAVFGEKKKVEDKRLGQIQMLWGK